ncbi:hypothetical protein GQ607_000349 [Colletotrichum asianum]|uniref:Uncharacterized protein n=1 Tax=Colletotrichum asianum TaxID=702518 RepID=A0A8H3ZUE2_9PEZI|nr:hypothetical protein GQ607_000349 [Colletotrichum asianum]
MPDGTVTTLTSQGILEGMGATLRVQTADRPHPSQASCQPRARAPMPRHQASQARVFAPTDYDDDNIPPPLPLLRLRSRVGWALLRARAGSCSG